MGYKSGELERLHCELYEILAVTISACDKLQIPYVVIGGTAIGAHYEGAILPWDDDIDIGIEGADYDRFLREIGAVLPTGYTLQSPLNEPNTPYYFAKIRKDNTLFIPEDEVGLDIHHGIYIDIFPLDRCPDSPLLERLQRFVVRLLGNAFVAGVGRLRGGKFGVMLYESAAKILSKSLVYRLLRRAQTAFNNCECSRVTIIRMDRDHIARETIHPAQVVDFGQLKIKAPRRLIEYLEWHYPGIVRYPAPEKRVNHAPTQLEFGENQPKK